MLDVHIAGSLDAATRNEPVVRIDLDVHKAFFNDRVGLTGECPTLRRMGDFFADCTFTGDDLENLVRDLDAVSQRAAPNSPCQTWVTKLRDACRIAISNKHSIFVLCD